MFAAFCCSGVVRLHLLWIDIGLLFWVYLLVGFVVWVICLFWFCGEVFDFLDFFAH